MRKLTRSHSTCTVGGNGGRDRGGPARSEEHTSELQSRSDLVCRLLLEKKKKTHKANPQKPGLAQRLGTDRRVLLVPSTAVAQSIVEQISPLEALLIIAATSRSTTSSDRLMFT